MESADPPGLRLVALGAFPLLRVDTHVELKRWGREEGEKGAQSSNTLSCEFQTISNIYTNGASLHDTEVGI